MGDTSKQHYPRGIPFREAPSPPPRSGRGGLGVFPGALGGAALVLVTAAATVLVIHLTASRPQAIEEARQQTEPAPRPTKPVPTAPTVTASKLGKERFLQALGGLSAAHVYQSYLNIGLLADGVESESYTKAEAEQMLATVSNMIDLADRQLDKIADADLDPDDRQGMKRIQELAVLLRRQASALRAYWATGGREQITRYHQTRETTWTSLSEVLGIE